MTGWLQYWEILRRRWWIVVGIVLLDVVVSLYLYEKAHRHVGYQACLTLYVADVSSPSLIAAPPTTLQTAGQLLAGETAANFFADDIKDVAGSSDVTTYISVKLGGKYSNASPADLNGSVSGNRLDRTVNLCLTNPDSGTALAAAKLLGTAMTTQRARFVGKNMAQRTFVDVVSPPGVGPAPSSNLKLTLALRVGLGVLVALGLALVWDALDPTVRGRRDVEAALRAPLIATFE